MHPLAKYSLKDFDKYNCLKLSLSFYLILLFLLRGFAIGIASLTNLKDKLSLIQWFYPESLQFYFSLLAGIPGLLVLYVIFQRKPEAANWVKILWANILYLCTALLALDILIYWSQYYIFQQGKLFFLVWQTIIAVLLLLYCRHSHRAKINRQEFPEVIEPLKVKN